MALHEIGHNLGLIHCTHHKDCLMNDAKGTIQQVDQEKIWFCSKCSKVFNKKNIIKQYFYFQKGKLMFILIRQASVVLITSIMFYVVSSIIIFEMKCKLILLISNKIF